MEVEQTEKERTEFYSWIIYSPSFHNVRYLDHFSLDSFLFCHRLHDLSSFLRDLHFLILHSINMITLYQLSFLHFIQNVIWFPKVIITGAPKMRERVRLFTTAVRLWIMHSLCPVLQMTITSAVNAWRISERQFSVAEIKATKNFIGG